MRSKIFFHQIHPERSQIPGPKLLICLDIEITGQNIATSEKLLVMDPTSAQDAEAPRSELPQPSRFCARIDCDGFGRMVKESDPISQLISLLLSQDHSHNSRNGESILDCRRDRSLADFIGGSDSVRHSVLNGI
jgi:hypothetical protein